MDVFTHLAVAITGFAIGSFLGSKIYDFARRK